MKKPIEIHPDSAECWVCKKEVPIEKLLYLGNNTYRCKSHRGSTILKAGEKYEQEKKIRQYKMTVEATITLEEI